MWITVLNIRKNDGKSICFYFKRVQLWTRCAQLCLSSKHGMQKCDAT